MWARILEFALACWLSISPFIFGAPKTERLFWINDLSCSALLALFSLLSFYKPLRRMHLGNLIIGVWLFSLGYFFTLPLPNYVQNDVLVGILLLILAIVPCDAEHPPLSWRNLQEKDGKSC